MNFNSLSKVLFLNFDKRNMKSSLYSSFYLFYCHSFAWFFFFLSKEKNICMKKSEWPNPWDCCLKGKRRRGREKEERKNILNKNNFAWHFPSKAFEQASQKKKKKRQQGRAGGEARVVGGWHWMWVFHFWHKDMFNILKIQVTFLMWSLSEKRKALLVSKSFFLFILIRNGIILGRQFDVIFFYDIFTVRTRAPVLCSYMTYRDFFFPSHQSLRNKLYSIRHKDYQ